MNRLYPHNAIIKEALKGCADFVVKGGLNYLIPNWKRIVRNVDIEDGAIIDEYLNDVDTRYLIDRVLKLLPESKRTKITSEIVLYDNEFTSKTFEVKDCLWGKKNEIIRGYNREENFYYYRAPQFIIDQNEEIHSI